MQPGVACGEGHLLPALEARLEAVRAQQEGRYLGSTPARLRVPVPVRGGRGAGGGRGGVDSLETSRVALGGVFESEIGARCASVILLRVRLLARGV